MFKATQGDLSDANQQYIINLESNNVEKVVKCDSQLK